MNFKQTTFLLIISLSLSSCQGQKTTQNSDEDDLQIFSMLIDELVLSFPPPLPPKEGFTAGQIDSINKVKVDWVVIDTLMYAIESNSPLPESYKEYQSLVIEISRLPEKTIASKQIQSNKVRNLKFDQSLKDAQIIGISRIAFNSDKSRAALYGGYSWGRLNGMVVLY